MKSRERKMKNKLKILKEKYKNKIQEYGNYVHKVKMQQERVIDEVNQQNGFIEEISNVL